MKIVSLKYNSPDPVLHDPSNAQNYNKYSYVLNNPLKYVDPSGYFYYGKYFAPDFMMMNRQLQFSSLEAWNNMKSQVGGGMDLTGDLILMLLGFSGGGGGGGGGSMVNQNLQPGTPGGEDITGDVVARENGHTYQMGYSLIEGVGILSGFYVSYSFVVQASDSKYLLSVSASAWAPYAEKVMDNTQYFGNVEIYDENGNFVKKETLGSDFFDHGSDIGITGYSYIGISNESIKPGYSAKLSVSYFSSLSFQGTYAGPTFSHWFSF